MITSAKNTAAFAIVLAVISSPSFAKKMEPHTSAARATALRECNAEADKYSSAAWQTEQFTVYRDCMFAHGQID